MGAAIKTVKCCWSCDRCDIDYYGNWCSFYCVEWATEVEGDNVCDKFKREE